VDGDQATADVLFDASTAVIKVDECITIEDTNVGGLGQACSAGGPDTFQHTFEYSLWFGKHPDADVLLVCGVNEHVNTASFSTEDTQSTGDDAWTVTANVTCGLGCTLTPGYWKTHSEYGPAPYDDTWALLASGADTGFFLSAQSYHEVLWTSPMGNAYYILAHAYIAAELNQLNGASIPPEVLEAFNDATALLNTYTPVAIAGLKGNNKTRKEFIDLAGILDDYNNGTTGPGHCSE
jgi:hypothetical protein